jgi:hypothetical protein
MNKYKAALLDILNFLLVCCDVKLSSEDIKDILSECDKVFKILPFDLGPRLNYFIIYACWIIIFPKLSLNCIESDQIVDGFSSWLSFINSSKGNSNDIH